MRRMAYLVLPCTDSSVDADASSTTCFALGKDGIELIENTKGAEAVFITEDFTLHKSSGIGSEIPFHEKLTVCCFDGHIVQPYAFTST